MEWFAYGVGKKFWRDTTTERKKAHGTTKTRAQGAAENNADKNREDLVQSNAKGLAVNRINEIRKTLGDKKLACAAMAIICFR
jgi:hypothetical protein